MRSQCRAGGKRRGLLSRFGWRGSGSGLAVGAGSGGLSRKLLAGGSGGSALLRGRALSGRSFLGGGAFLDRRFLLGGGRGIGAPNQQEHSGHCRESQESLHEL